MFLASAICVSALVTAADLPAEPSRRWTPAGALAFDGVLLQVDGIDARYSGLASVIQRADGRVRCYDLRDLSADDQTYVRGAMARVPTNHGGPHFRDLGQHKARDLGYPDTGDSKPTTYETDHFRFFWASRATGDAAWWNKPEERQKRFDYFERVWRFFNEAGAHMPHESVDAANGRTTKTPDRRKVDVFITGTGLRHHAEGFAFGAESIVVHPAALGDGSSVVPHEFGHVLQYYSGGNRDSRLVGWFWENHGNWCSQQFTPTYPPCMDAYLDRLNYELSSERMNYCSWMMLQLMTETPELGGSFIWKLWRESLRSDTGAALESPIQTMIRLGAAQGTFARPGSPDGHEGFADLAGTLAARLVSMDFRNQPIYLKTVREVERRQERRTRWRVPLNPVAGTDRLFAPPLAVVPMDYGINLADIRPTEGAKTVTVTLLGQSAFPAEQGWRCSIVGVDGDFNARYSTVVPAGTPTTLEVLPGERYTLAIASTPRKYTPVSPDESYGARRRALYRVKLDNAVPEDRLEATLRPVPAVSADAAPPPGMTRHPRGGGLVATTAKVSPEAFIGPQAVVLESATVAAGARVEGRAIVRGRATVTDKAIIRGHARVGDQATIGGESLVTGYATVRERVTVAGNAHVTEWSAVLGQGTVTGNTLVQGCGEIMLHSPPGKEGKGLIDGYTVIGNDQEMHIAGITVKPGLYWGFVDAERHTPKPSGDGLIARWDFGVPAGVDASAAVVCDSHTGHDAIIEGSARRTVDGLVLNSPDQFVRLDPSTLDRRRWQADVEFSGSGTVLAFGDADGSVVLAYDAAEHAARVIDRGTVLLTLPVATPPGQPVRLTITGLDGQIRLGAGSDRTAGPVQLPMRNDPVTWVTLGRDLGPGRPGTAAGFSGTIHQGSIRRPID